MHPDTCCTKAAEYVDKTYAVKPLGAHTGGMWASNQHGHTPAEAAADYARRFGAEYARDGKLLVVVAVEDDRGNVRMTDVRAFEITFDGITVTGL